MEATTIFIWMLRVVPMVLFWLYLRGDQSPKKKTPATETGRSLRSLETGGKNVVAMEVMLQHRQRLLGKPAPTDMQTIQLVDQSSQPSLFPQKPRRESAPKDRDRKKKEKKGADGVSKEIARQEQEAAVKASDKMHLEALVNYMAFDSKEQQRAFLLDKEEAETDAFKISDKANSMAQMVLKGAIKSKRCDVATELYSQLTESQVEVAEMTFSYLIEACTCVCDLKDAGNFLVKMEAAGYCPDADLLDKVMVLHSQQKANSMFLDSTESMELPMGDQSYWGSGNTSSMGNSTGQHFQPFNFEAYSDDEEDEA